MLCTGIDIIEIPRFQRAVERWGGRLLRRVFTPQELADCGTGQDTASIASLAARWAAKEATAKALGVGLRGLGGASSDTMAAQAMSALPRVGWHEIAVVRGPQRRPVLQLTATAAAVAAQQGIGELAVSLSHSEHYAVASVVGM